MIFYLERAVYDAFDNASDYDELEDDFLFIANDGKVAIEAIADQPKPTLHVDREDNTDVQILECEEDETEKALREYREKMAALLPP